MNRARARHQGVRRQVRHRGAAPPGRGGAQGRLGRRARLRPAAAALRSTTRRRTRPPSPARLREPQRRHQRVRALPRVERDAAAPGGLLDRADQGHPRRPHARAVPRARRGHARLLAAATPARPSHQNLVLRWVRDESVYDVWQRLVELGLGDAGADEINDVVSAARAPTRASSASPARWASTQAVRERLDEMEINDPLTQAHPHQDVRLPERLQPAPHREHRVLRRVDQGRRPHGPGLRRPHRRPLRGRRGRLRHAAEGRACRPSASRTRVERWLRIYEAEREDGEAFNAFAERVGADALRGRWCATSPCRSSSTSRT